MGLRGGSQAPSKRRFLLEIKAVGNRALKQTVRSVRAIERSTRRLKREMTGLRRIFFATFAGIGVKTIADAADNVQLLSDRINIFAGDTVEGTRALNLLFDAANLTNTSIDSLAETFNRVALATQELGLNIDELVGFTATLQNTFRLSGASIAESSAAAIQLSQGLASGQLRGQELRSVLEQNAVIGQILADTLNTTRGNLIKFAESGKITSEVVLTALAENAEKLNEKAQGLGQTFGQTITKALNDAKRAINELNKRFKLNEKFQEAVEKVVAALKDFGTFLFRSGGVLDKVTPKFEKFVKLLKSGIADALEIDTLEGLKKQLEEEKKVLALLNEQEQAVKDAYGGKTYAYFKKPNAGGRGSFSIFDSIFGGFRNVSEFKREVELQKVVAEGTILDLEARIKKLGNTGEDTGKKVNNALGAINAFAKGNYKAQLKDAQLSLEDLNNAFNSGFIGISRYRDELRRIEQENLTKRFEEGAITLLEYQEGLVKLGQQADTTFGKLRQGFELGSRSYVQSAQNLTLQFSKLVDNTFGNLENAIFDFTKGTGDAFAKLTQQILDDLLRIAIRSRIIAPIAGGVEGLFSTTSAVGVNGQFSQNPNAITARQGRVFKYAQGGVVDRPTAFPMSRGTGLMAEAGAPEAVVPLTRTSDGDLGVQAIPNNVTVNVNNQAGVEVEVDSLQDGNNQFIDITITKAVNKAISEGRLDRSLSSNFGISRRGNR